MIFNKKRKIDNMKFLMYVDTDTEACVIQGLLDSCGIVSQLDYDTIGGNINVIIGKSNLGVNIFVHENDYEKALEIIDSEMYNEITEED